MLGIAATVNIYAYLCWAVIQYSPFRIVLNHVGAPDLLSCIGFPDWLDPVGCPDFVVSITTVNINMYLCWRFCLNEVTLTCFCHWSLYHGFDLQTCRYLLLLHVCHLCGVLCAFLRLVCLVRLVCLLRLVYHLSKVS